MTETMTETATETTTEATPAPPPAAGIAPAPAHTAGIASAPGIAPMPATAPAPWPPPAPTYREVVEAWALEREALGLVEAHTARKAAQKALLFEPWAGARPAGAMGPADVARALAGLGSRGGREGEGLAPGTLRAAHTAGRQAMDWAVSRGLAASNPFRGVPRPRGGARPARFLDASQASALNGQMGATLRACMQAGDVQRASFALAALIALATGLRRGEVFALEWGDFDRRAMRLRVARAVKAGGAVGPPKSASGARSVAVGANLARLLSRARAWQRRRVPARGWPEGDYVVCNAAGARASISTFEAWWRSWARSHGWPGLRFHDLRHSHATILIAGGVDVKTVQARLGHSSPSITLSVYAHALPLSDSSAAAALDEALFS